ncbi:hypothetical protein BLNAU_5797 [Blattamonas nauphoetae]|uniref:LXG domain-containing protein n=1 Tax=Blattamonas nauphoetae TaxID=2049346 RepID=A0ABQ9Y6B3_9EUKA|nr:hypothetical protein BLNAU_5797 [Blattamonas nauphoetae]
MEELNSVFAEITSSVDAVLSIRKESGDQNSIQSHISDQEQLGMIITEAYFQSRDLDQEFTSALDEAKNAFDKANNQLQSVLYAFKKTEDDIRQYRQYNFPEDKLQLATPFDILNSTDADKSRSLIETDVIKFTQTSIEHEKAERKQLIREKKNFHSQISDGNSIIADQDKQAKEITEQLHSIKESVLPLLSLLNPEQTPESPSPLPSSGEET